VLRRFCWTQLFIHVEYNGIFDGEMDGDTESEREREREREKETDKKSKEKNYNEYKYNSSVLLVLQFTAGKQKLVLNRGGIVQLL
jgi:hypothetical protein